MRRLLLSIFALLTFGMFYSQNFYRAGDWKKYRKELFISLGSSHFLGDLGGRDKIGTDYSPVDLDFNQTRTAFGLGYRYKAYSWLCFTSTFNYLILKGDDAQTKEQFRNNRNLNFKSNIFELSGRVEIGYSSGRAGNRYGIKKTLTRRMKNRQWNFFIYSGVGGFYYNPKGKSPKGSYINLKPLHTEGQGLPGGPKQYSNFSVCIPFGAYYKVVINKQWSVGIDVCWRKTFTDYIDDVGTSYYSADSLAKYYGPVSAQMADPSLGLIYGASLPAADGTPAQRGDIQKDSYITAQITVGYIFKKQRRKTARLRSKF